MKEFCQEQSWEEVIARSYPYILNCISVVINENLVLFDLAKRMPKKLTLMQIF